MQSIDLEQLVERSGLRSAQSKALLLALGKGIVCGDYGVGAQLPAERELAEQHNISRGAARNVLGQLERAGLVERVRSSGTFVTFRRNGAGENPVTETFNAVAFDPEIGPADLMEARLMLEPLLPELIVANATASDFAVMNECIEKAQAAQTIDEYEKWDGALHTAFATATHNAFYVHLFRLMQTIREVGEWGRLKHRSLTETKRSRYQEHHRRIVEALKDRDAVTARRLMQEHLREVKQNLFGVS